MCKLFCSFKTFVGVAGRYFLNHNGLLDPQTYRRNKDTYLMIVHIPPRLLIQVIPASQIRADEERQAKHLSGTGHIRISEEKVWHGRRGEDKYGGL